MKKEDYNTVFYDLQMAGIPCHPSTVKSLIDSRYAQNFNPFEAYFYGLKPYDGQTDSHSAVGSHGKDDQPTFLGGLPETVAGGHGGLRAG